MTNSCLNNFESILVSIWYILSPDSLENSGSISLLSFGAFINKSLLSGYSVIVIATVRLIWALADLALISLRKVGISPWAYF
jgi:hypothetical protein